MLVPSYIQCMWPIKPWVLVIGNVLLGESTSDLSLSLVLLVPDLMQTSFTVLSVMSSSSPLDGRLLKCAINMQIRLLLCLCKINEIE